MKKTLWQVVSSALTPMGWLWGRLMLARRRAYQIGFFPAYRPRAKVISVGNLTLGGEGKTPLVLWLARFLARKSRVVILTRGYKGRLKGPVVASRGEGPLFSPEEIGDEAFLLAQQAKVPVMVARDRVAGAFWAQKEFEAEILILDDGFQHLRLERDLDLVLFSASSHPEKERLFPAGRLREPLSVLSQASAFVVTKTNLLVENLALLNFLKKFRAPVFRIPYLLGEPYLLEGSSKGLPPKVVAFCGLAQGESFFRGLEAKGIELRARLSFADHHRYSPRDLKKLRSLAEKHAAPLATTEKDAVKLFPFARDLPPCYVFPLNPAPGEEFARFVTERLDLSPAR